MQVEAQLGLLNWNKKWKKLRQSKHLLNIFSANCTNSMRRSDSEANHTYMTTKQTTDQPVSHEFTHSVKEHERTRSCRRCCPSWSCCKNITKQKKPRNANHAPLSAFNTLCSVSLLRCTVMQSNTQPTNHSVKTLNRIELSGTYVEVSANLS